MQSPVKFCQESKIYLFLESNCLLFRSLAPISSLYFFLAPISSSFLTVFYDWEGGGRGAGVDMKY